MFIAGFGQRTQNLSVYLTNMKGWLADSAFWTEAEGYVRFWAQEIYGDVRAWGVPDAPGMTRAEHLAAYLMHPLTLARAGGDRTAAAGRSSARVPSRSRTQPWKWQSGFGFTDVDHLLMRHFVSEQVFAIRHDAGTHPAEGPEGRLGFAWAPEQRGETDFAVKTAGLAAAARVCAGERVRAGRRLATRRVRPSRRPRVVRGQLRRSGVQRGVGRLLEPLDESTTRKQRPVPGLESGTGRPTSGVRPCARDGRRRGRRG